MNAVGRTKSGRFDSVLTLTPEEDTQAAEWAIRSTIAATDMVAPAALLRQFDCDQACPWPRDRDRLSPSLGSAVGSVTSARGPKAILLFCPDPRASWYLGSSYSQSVGASSSGRQLLAVPRSATFFIAASQHRLTAEGVGSGGWGRRPCRSTARTAGRN